MDVTELIKKIVSFKKKLKFIQLMMKIGLMLGNGQITKIL